MLKNIWKSFLKRIKSVYTKASVDKWAEKQIKEMAKLRGKLILM